MSDVKQAIDFVLRQEDASMSGVITSNRGDTGGRTRFGIAEKWHPNLTATGFYDGMSSAAALAVAEGIYVNEYANPLYLQAINSQALATALLSLAVVEGKGTAVNILQQCAGVPVDGQMGPHTVNAINSQPCKPLMDKYALCQRAHFDRIAANDHTQLRFVNGWKNRMNSVEQLA